MRIDRLSPQLALSRLHSFTMPQATTPPRRITRSSLARFAYAADSDAAKPEKDSNAESDVDIEDAIPDTRRARGVSGSRKRKRSPTAAGPAVGPEGTAAPKARKVRLAARPTTDAATGATTMAPPSDWEHMYELVRAMRRPGGAAANAAVDTMGCERLAAPGASPRRRRFHTLVALMLSSQTKDTVNAAAMARLQAELPPHEPGAAPGLTLENVLAVAPDLLNRLIWAVGFHNNKTR